MSWHGRRELWRGLCRVAEMVVLALDMRLIQLLTGKYREKAGCPLEKDILDGRQSSGNQNPADSGISPVPYKWNYIPMPAESSVPYVLYALGPLPSAPVHPFPNLVSARCFCPHLNAQNITEQYKMMAPSLPRLKLV